MKNNKLIPISIIILAISIFSGLMWVGYSIQEIASDGDNETNIEREKGLLTVVEASEYLSISVDELESILLKDSTIKEGLRGYSTYRFIPFIEVNNGKKLFSKEELDKWISHNMVNKY